MKKLLLSVFAMSALLVGCGDDDSVSLTKKLTLSITGLEDLGSNFVYEGWVIVAGAPDPISTGTFKVNSGTLSATTFDVNTVTLDAATKFVLTIEPAGETGAAALAPSDHKLLAGDFSGTTANVSVSVAPASLGDFTGISGKMFLRTPTDEAAGSPNNGNDENGIWFGTPTTTPPSSGLILPTLPLDADDDPVWVYEGWVVTANGPISTGTFSEFETQDSDNPFSGMENRLGPPIPGEDFFLNAPSGQTFPLDVRGKTVVISIEPVPDNDPAPFLLKPLLKTLPADAATAPTTHAFEVGTLPTGTVTR